MKHILLKLVFLFVTTNCICGMCSKDSSTTNSNNNADNLIEPVLKPDATWLYFDDVSSLVYFYDNNKRPQSEKWVATKTGTAISGLNNSNGKRYLSWSFENTGDTRFLSKTLNPGGKETMSVDINNFSVTPGPGTYTLDLDYKQGYCWYSVYTSSGALHDSVRTQGISTSSLNITKMEFAQSIGSTIDRYKMSGNASFNIMYWANGMSSTTDIHSLQCTFNNVFIDFLK